MLPKLRAHVRSQFVGYIALFVALGGTAYAAVVVSSNSQVAPGTISGHRPPSGKHPNVIAGSINGKDIADNSGVETCTRPLVARYGRICAGSDGVARTATEAMKYCAQYDLHLPSLSQAITLARQHDVPGVDDVMPGDQHEDRFWTDNRFYSGAQLDQTAVNEDGGQTLQPDTFQAKTVCVTDPTA